MSKYSILPFNKFILVVMVTIQMIFPPSLWATDDSAYLAEKLQCEQDPAKKWDSDLNRCVFTQQTLDTRASYLDCSEAPEEEQDACITRYANEQIEFEANRADGWGFAEGATNVAYAVGMGFTVMAFIGKGAPGGCTSKTIFTLGSLGALGFELYQYFALRDKLKNLNGEFNRKENIYNSQLEAFGYLKNEQETIADITKQKAWFYTGIGVVFAAAAIVGYYEAYTGNGSCKTNSEQKQNNNQKQPPTNQKSNPTPPKLQPQVPYIKGPESLDEQKIAFNYNLFMKKDFQFERIIYPEEYTSIENYIFHIKEQNMVDRSPSIDDYNKFVTENKSTLNELNKNVDAVKDALKFIAIMAKNSVIQNAIAQDELGSTDSKISFTDRQYESIETNDLWTLMIMGSGIVLGLLGSLSQTITQAMTTSLGIAIMATTQTVFSGLMASYNFVQSSDSTENAAKVQTVIDEFVSSVSSYCPDGREDLNNPMCYCYTGDNKKNPDRANSKTCQDLWAQMEKSYFVSTSDFTTKQTEPKLCYTFEGKLDPDCECKKYISKSTGENACYKSAGISGFGASIGGGLNISPIAASVTAMGQGDYSSASNLNNGSTLQNAAKARKALDQAIDQYNKSAAKNNKSGLPNAETIARSQMSNMAPTLKNLIGASPTDQLIQSNRPGGDKAETINKALEKIGDDGISYSPTKKKDKKKDDEFNFVLNENAKNVKQVNDSFPEKNFDFKDNDITKDEKASIWDVLSKRYNTSGLRRLFGE